MAGKRTWIVIASPYSPDDASDDLAIDGGTPTPASNPSFVDGGTP